MVPDDVLKERTPRPEPGSTRLQPSTCSAQAEQKGEKLCPHVGDRAFLFRVWGGVGNEASEIGSAVGTEVPGSSVELLADSVQEKQTLVWCFRDFFFVRIQKKAGPSTALRSGRDDKVKKFQKRHASCGAGCSSTFPGLKATSFMPAFPRPEGRGFYRRPAHAGPLRVRGPVHPVSAWCGPVR